MIHLSSEYQIKKSLGGLNLYLVGMMGSGKSSTAPFLAEKLSYGFVDLDQAIEAICGKAIAKIFEEDGEQEFRSIETQVLKAIGQRHSLIVATGGGVVTRVENWGVLHQGVVIWIDPGITRLSCRLRNDPGERPLLKTKTTEAFSQLCLEREKYYSEADLHLKVEEETPKEVAQKILTRLPLILNTPPD